MRLTKEETKARIFSDLDAAVDKAAELNDLKNPHLTGELAHVVTDRSRWPNQRYAIGIYRTDTGVRVGFLAAALALAMAGGCVKQCSKRPHYHQDAPSAEFVPCGSDLDCQIKNGGEY